MQVSGNISSVRLGNNAAARIFCRSVKQQKKRDLPASPVLCLSRLFNVVYLSTCSSIFACSKIDNSSDR